MIRYTVLWSMAAESELATLWSSYRNRSDITRAADRIDSDLREDAHRKGFLLPRSLRMLSHSPLIVYFRVDEADRKVLVEGVQLTEVN
jgi:hypothetical protein